MTDERPATCRFRLHDEGKAYPRSGCMGCGRNITTGLGSSCHKVATPTPSRTVDDGFHIFKATERHGVHGPCMECGFTLRDGDHIKNEDLDSHLLDTTPMTDGLERRRPTSWQERIDNLEKVLVELETGISSIRNDALEEAACEAENGYTTGIVPSFEPYASGRRNAASVIRALKTDKPSSA